VLVDTGYASIRRNHNELPIQRSNQEVYASASGTSAADSPPGIATYVDALAGLAPGEVLAAHAVIVGLTTSAGRVVILLAQIEPLSGDSELDFADQAHFTRAFKAAFGMTPGRYARLRASHGPAASLSVVAVR
jgi:hypothetical protein